MSIDHLFLYVSTVFIASIIPGPSMLLALNHGSRYGVQKTVASASGNVAASLIQAIISITGLSIILTQSKQLYSLIKYAGAAYLIYLGIKAFLERDKKTDTEQNISVEDSLGNSSRLRLFGQSFLVAFCNPKAVIFFTALFPQFIDIQSAPVPQVILMLLLLCLIAFVCFMLYAFFGNKLTLLLFKPGRARWFNRIIGVLFVALGCTVIVSDFD